MWKCYLDSNVLIGYTFAASTFREKSLRLLSSLSPDKCKLCTSPLAIDELLHSLSFLLRREGSSASEINKNLRKSLSSILSLPMLSIVNPSTDKEQQLKILDFMSEYSLKPRDAYHFLIMKEQGIEYFATFDKDFDKVFQNREIRPIKENRSYGQ